MQQCLAQGSPRGMLSIFDIGPPPPCPSPFNLAAHVLAQADKVPDKPALEVLGRDGGAAQRWSYAQLRTAVLATAQGLLDRGLAPGDIVLMRLGNTVDFPIAYLGAIAAGLVPVPTSTQLTEAETRAMVGILSPAAILHDPVVASTAHKRTIVIDDLRAMREGPAATGYHMGDPDRPGYIVFTSGTSGQPRAVVHAHRAIWARQMMMQGWYGIGPQDRVLHAGAFNWTYTLGTGLMDPWTAGATALIPEPGTEIADIPDLLAAHAATIFAAAPGVYRKILNAGTAARVSGLRHGLTAGEKLSPDLAARWSQTTGTALYEAYGMSEVSTFISSSPAHPATDGALGRPQSGRRVAIIDAQGDPVPLNTPGVIAVSRRDPGLMLGYHGQPEETRARMIGEWFVTGDMGAMSEDGQIAYFGRNDDMMNAGGYRVSPLEVEAALAGYDGLGQVAVTDVEIKPGIHVIAAFYTAPAPLDHDALHAFAQSRLARYKQPRLFVHLDALPTGANGKLTRRALKPLAPKRQET